MQDTQELTELGQAVSAQLDTMATGGVTVVAVAALIQSMLTFVEVAGPWLRAARGRSSTAA